ncbi:Lrp/AsnC family transcriptional regulator [Agarivorans sp. QJM3NY_30]|uniref:Lrp/AsnC family transcriptional regulator n=1 Tax=unclassified Agarivorans TaxID=2636026 RepID=UPI003F6B09C4
MSREYVTAFKVIDSALPQRVFLKSSSSSLINKRVVCSIKAGENSISFPICIHKRKMKLDSKDKLILNLLQRDVSIPLNEIAERVGLSATPCWRRVQKLENAGFIRHKVALLDRQKLNLGVTVFVSVRTAQHDPQWLALFKQAIEDIPEIIEAHRMSGSVDYLLQVVVPSIDDYDQVYKKLIERLAFTDVSSAFSMEVMKSTTALPTHYMS